jgi:hypothetical protein
MIAEIGFTISWVISILVNMAANPKIVIGLLHVIITVERKSDKSPFLHNLGPELYLCSNKILCPKNTKNKTANACKKSLYKRRKSQTNAIQKIATTEYTASMVAVHNPLTNPERRPLLRLRRIHKTPTGPIGAATENQIIIHFNRRGRYIIWSRE